VGEPEGIGENSWSVPDSPVVCPRFPDSLIFKLVGGIGLLLLGMVLLTDGLKALASDALRRASEA
jgi:hypothetical protein